MPKDNNTVQISIYGQEYTATTYKLAKMNLAIRGISANLGDVPADTFGKDQHKDLKADYIMANPPFNQKAWREANELLANLLTSLAGEGFERAFFVSEDWALNKTTNLVLSKQYHTY